jgi:Predicted hydrolases or acyltransferases (alpha/beta hydrolase superfamily)
MINIKNGPEVLTIHGTNDRWVPYQQAQLLQKKLNKKHHLLTIEGGGHYYFSEEEDNLIRNKITAFISKYIKD